jgi:hypothetical protein
MMRDLELEMAGLTPDIRRARMPEFHSRGIVLSQHLTVIEVGVSEFERATKDVIFYFFFEMSGGVEVVCRDAETLVKRAGSKAIAQ